MKTGNMKTQHLLVVIFFLSSFNASNSYAGPQGDDGDQVRMNKPVPAPQAETKELYIVLEPGVDPQQFAAANGLVLVKSSPAMAGRNSHVFAAQNAEVARAKLPALTARASVMGAHLNELETDAVVFEEPNDPYFAHNDFGGQWTMADGIPGPFGEDSSLLGAWSQGYRGNGIVIGVMDHGVETLHPDLLLRHFPALSFDYLDNDSNPNPMFANENHGTAVTGICSATADNGIGVSGAAPHSEFASIRPGLRVDDDNGNAIPASLGTTQSFVDSIVHGGSSIDVKNHSWGTSAPFSANTAYRNAFAEPNGQIHVVAAGNARSRGPTQDAGKTITNTSAHNIVVGALGADGDFASYSSFGSVLMCCTGSQRSASFGYAVTTTDRTGAAGYNDGSNSGDYSSADGLPNPADYTAGFNGTSASAPLAAGIIALAVEANPFFDRFNLGHLIVRSCDMVDPDDNTVASDGGWRTNGAGFPYNQNYGFGKLNAAKLVSVAQKYAAGTRGSGTTSATTPIPPGSGHSLNIADGTSRLVMPFNFPAGRIGKVTDLTLHVDVTHPRRGDLEFIIRSPSGFQSRLFSADADDTDANISSAFPLRTVAFWGEEYEGQWYLFLYDRVAGQAGALNSLTVDTHLSELIEVDLPDNDDIADAYELTDLEFSTDSGHNRRATSEPFESGITSSIGRRGVWWRGTATTSGILEVNTFGSDFDTQLQVYRANSYDVQDLELLAHNDDSGGGRQSQVMVPVVTGDQIAIRVSGYDNATGNIEVQASGLLGPRFIVNGSELVVVGNGSDNDIHVSPSGFFDTFVRVDAVEHTFPNITDVSVLGHGGNDTITSNFPGARLNGMDGDDDILFFGNGTTSVLIGGNGNDIIRGGSGPDEIYGSAGNDELIGRAGNDLLFGGPGIDVIRGISGRNTIFGNAGDDEIFGGTGSDEIDGGIGNDTVFGGAGADVIRGGDGLNILDGGVAGDTIIGGTSRDVIFGGAGNDSIFGLDGNDRLEGGAGSDEIIGGFGNDLIRGGLGLDQLFGSSGHDTIFGDESSDFISGGIGHDVLDGGSGPDEIQGDSGNDQLTGGDGFDALHGGSGTDTATDTGEAAETGIEN